MILIINCMIHLQSHWLCIITPHFECNIISSVINSKWGPNQSRLLIALSLTLSLTDHQPPAPRLVALILNIFSRWRRHFLYTKMAAVNYQRLHSRFVNQFATLFIPLFTYLCHPMLSCDNCPVVGPTNQPTKSIPRALLSWVGLSSLLLILFLRFFA
jgi:hypothetical protein